MEFYGRFLALAGLGLAPAQIRSFSQKLYNYIIHVQTENAAFMISLGMAMIGLALFGIRHRESWALCTALLSSLTAIAIAVPLHYPFYFATLGHLGPMNVVLTILLSGTIFSYRAMRV